MDLTQEKLQSKKRKNGAKHVSKAYTADYIHSAGRAVKKANYLQRRKLTELCYQLKKKDNSLEICKYLKNQIFKFANS